MDTICGWLSEKPVKVLLIVFVALIPLFSFFVIYPFNIESDVRRGFAQRNGRSTEEFKSFADFYNITYEGLEIWVVLITAKNSSNDDMVMSSEVLQEVERLDKFVQNFSTLYNGETVRFDESQGAKINYLFNWYKYAYELSEFLPGSINLSFPVGSAIGHSFFIGSHFFGVNRNKESERGPIESMRYVTLWYMSQASTFEEKKRLEAVQMALFDLSRKDNFSSIVSWEMYGDQVANAEMLRGTMSTIRLFAVGIVIMVVFMLVMFSHLTVKSQCLLTLAALAAPSIATATCFALLGWLGVPFNSIMCITPFLVMGIGVDDAFLLLHCWRRLVGVPNKKERLSCVIYEIGPSMAITSLTNTMAFGIGITSPTPQMSGFCLCTAIAVLFDFVFEFLIFVPAMILFYEEKSDKKGSIEQRDGFFTWNRYTSTLLSNFGRFCVLILTVLLYVSASIGVSGLVPSFDPSKTFPSDSDLMTSLRNFENIQSEYSPVNFVTRRLPDLANSSDTAKYFEMIERLENRPYCYGKERTQLLLRDYLEMTHENETRTSYEEIPKFIEDRMISDKSIIQYHTANGSVIMEGINFIVICRGSLDWNIRAQHIDEARSIIDEYPQFNTTLFDYDSTIYDLIITVKHELIKAVLLTFICMGVTCAFMIPSVVGASIAALSMLSISYSLLGWLSICGQDLDPVTMINVLMAIGFSVDFSAHVCYHYHIGIRNHCALPGVDRITRILTNVGRPMVEASLSTILCMFPLFFVPVYIIEAFARTVCLVASLGLLHGIVIIPVILSFLSPNKPNQPPPKETERMLNPTSQL